MEATMTDEQIYSVTNLICAQSNVKNVNAMELKSDEPPLESVPVDLQQRLESEFNTFYPNQKGHRLTLVISTLQCTQTIEEKEQWMELEVSDFQCTHSVERKVDEDSLLSQILKLEMQLDHERDLVMQSGERFKELEEKLKGTESELQSSQDTIYRKDKALWALNGVQRELKKMDLESLHDLETNLIGSLQNVRQVIAKKQENEDECVVCRDRKKNTVLVPCGHCLCSTCSLRVERCPMCRAQIERTVQLR